MAAKIECCGVIATFDDERDAWTAPHAWTQRLLNASWKASKLTTPGYMPDRAVFAANEAARLLNANIRELPETNAAEYPHVN